MMTTVSHDFEKLLAHGSEVDAFLRGEQPRVITLTIDPTLRCNHACPQCTYGHLDRSEEINDAVFDSLVGSVAGMKIKGVMFTGGGEPCMHPRIGELVGKMAVSNASLMMTTNGQLIDRQLSTFTKKLSGMRISMDAASPKVYASVHGVSRSSFDRTVSNILALVAERRAQQSALKIGIGFLVSPETIADVEQAVDFYGGLGVDFLHFRPMHIHDGRCWTYPHIEGATEIMERVEGRHGGLDVSVYRMPCLDGAPKGPPPYRMCHASLFTITVGADSNVYTCCHHKYNPAFVWGSLKCHYLQWIVAHPQHHINGKCFRGCRLDAMNEMLERGLAAPDVLRMLLRYDEIKPGAMERWV